ncbi:reverse transcriptase-like protein, partial [Corynebacterium sp.]
MKVIIYADGGSRGNPGVAGSGTVIYDGSGQRILREIVYVVGTKSTNNVAEYNGLLRGLEAATEMGATEVEFHMDSKLVVEQINGRWKIKHPDMQKLALRARDYINGFSSFSLDWVPRAKNKVADALSNDAMDAAAAGHPEGIVAGEKDTAEPAQATEHDTTAPHPTDWLGDRGPTTRFILLRHGQTDMSAAKQYSGRANPGLTQLGQKQA